MVTGESGTAEDEPGDLFGRFHLHSGLNVAVDPVGAGNAIGGSCGREIVEAVGVGAR